MNDANVSGEESGGGDADDSLASDAIEAQTLQNSWSLTNKWNTNESLWITAFVCLQVALIVVSAFLPSRRIEYLSCHVMFAIVLAESALATSWLRFGPGPVSARIMIAPCWIAIGAGLGGVISRREQAIPILFTVAISVALLLIVILFVLRYMLRIQLVKDHSLSPSWTFQFGIIHWFVLTLCIAAILGFGRFAAKNGTIGRPNDFTTSVTLGVSWTLSLLPTILIPLWHTSGRRLLLGIGLCFVLTSTTAVCAAYLLWNLLTTVNSQTILGALYLITIPLFACVIIIGSLLMIRGAGFRLARRNL